MEGDIKLTNDRIRKEYWFHNALLSIVLRSKKRDKNIWVFGCWEGNRYDDSSKYLFEYVLSKCPEIKAYWITKNKNVVAQLSEENKPVLEFGSKIAKEILMNAGVGFYSNGLDDLGYICYLSGALIIDLNHAPIAAKALCYFNFENKPFPLKQFKQLKRALFNWFYFDYSIAPSETAKKFWLNAFCIKNKDKIRIMGLPRYDVLLGAEYVKIKYPEFYDGDEHYILYMPTYRKYPNSVISDFVSALSIDDAFIDLLKKKNYKIVIKPHYAEVFNKNINSSDRFVILDSNTNVSTQELLSLSDVLITDYSSCCVDFSITGRSVLIYTPDLKTYIDHNGVAQEFSVIYESKYVIKELEKMKEVLTEILVGQNVCLEISNMISTMFNECSTQDGSYSEQITNFVKDSIGKES